MSNDGAFTCGRCGHTGQPKMRMAGTIGGDALLCSKCGRWTEG